MPRPTSQRTRRSDATVAAVPARLVEGIKAANDTLLGGLAHDANLARDAAIHAPDLGQLAVVQFEWAAEQCARGAQAWASVWSALFDAQATCWRDAEAFSRAGLQPWLAAARSELPVNGNLESMTADFSPQMLMQRAAAVWTILGQTWINAMEHDLGEDQPPRG